MFPRKSGGLPPDAPFKPNLQELGYFVTGDGALRSLRDPSKGFHFHINKVFRWNEVNREAMHTCMRAELGRRFKDEGIVQFHLPHMTTTKPKSAHVPILTSSPDLLRKKKQVVVVLNEAVQDLGIWTWRAMEQEGGMTFGTALGLARGLKKCKDEAPGLIVANLGQLLYSAKYGRAVTRESWNSFPRESAVHPPPMVHPQRNLIAGNKTPEDHIQFVFDNVILNPDLVAKDAEIYVVGLGTGADEVLQCFDRQWPRYAARISAIALTSPSLRPGSINNPGFKTFLAQRARAWTSSEAPLNACVTQPKSATVSSANATGTKDDIDSGPQQYSLSPTLSCGEELPIECIFTKVYSVVLNWFFRDVAADVKGYKNPDFELFEFPDEYLENGYDGAQSLHQSENNAADTGDGANDLNLGQLAINGARDSVWTQGVSQR